MINVTLMKTSIEIHMNKKICILVILVPTALKTNYLIFVHGELLLLKRLTFVKVYNEWFHNC